MNLSIKEINKIIKADSQLSRVCNPEMDIKFFLTDSRTPVNYRDTLFFAINSKNGNDGHAYLKNLYDKGVRNFVGQCMPDFIRDHKDINYLVVEDTIGALQKISAYIHYDNIIYVAIAGSKGKTTVKELIYQAMEPIKKVSRSPRSFNSQIGVPLSLLQIDKTSEFALIETGFSQKGELASLGECIRPEVLILLNLVTDDNEEFSSINEKAEEFFSLIKSPDLKTLLYNSDDKTLESLVNKTSVSDLKFLGWSFKKKKADIFFSVHMINEKTHILKCKFEGGEFEMKLTVSSKSDFENYAAVVSFLISQNIEPKIIKERIEKIRPSGTRINVSEGVNASVLLEDTYINDESTLPQALDFMMRRKTNHRFTKVILGDIICQKENVEDAYSNVAQILKEAGIDKIIAVGRQISSMRGHFPENAKFYDDMQSFLEDSGTSDFVNDIILLRPSYRGDFSKIKELLEAKSHETVLEVNLSALRDNYKYFKSFIPSSTGIIAMVKASGYGAGSYEIAKTLQDCGASYLAVAVPDEGVELRKRGIVLPIIVMNPKVVDYNSLFTNNLEPEIYSLEVLKEIIKEAEKSKREDYPVHIKLDTGMHRMGFIENELDELIKLVSETRAIKIKTLFSHLATADCLDLDDFTMKQFSVFAHMTDLIEKKINCRIKKHILNSAGIIRFPGHHYDYVRLGIGLYGCNTLPHELEKPLSVVSTLKTVIISIREWEPSETIGYGRKGVLNKKTKVATIPIGYADGMNRLFGNGRIQVLINGKKAPTIGNICMDACMIDVTDIDCKVGDRVEIFGENIDINILAETIGTIPYEILTSVSPRVKRTYFRE